MKRREGSERKVRSDKKKCVQPLLSLELKKELFRFSFICREPMKDAAERLCYEGATSTLIFDEINQYFRRHVSIENHHYRGQLERPRVNLLQDRAEKVTIRFTQDHFEPLFNLAYALDLPLNQTATILIKKTLNNRAFMAYYIQSHCKHLNDKEKENLHVFLRGVWGFR